VRIYIYSSIYFMSLCSLCAFILFSIRNVTIFTDRFSTGGNAIASVRTSVRLSVRSTLILNRVSFTLTSAWVMIIAPMRMKIKTSGHG